MEHIEVERAVSTIGNRTLAGSNVEGLADGRSSARDDARATIIALGHAAKKMVLTGQLRHFAELCDRADWLFDGTSFQNTELLPDRISVEADLTIMANMLDHGYSATMISQLVSLFGVINGPISAMGLVTAPTLADALHILRRIIVVNNPHVEIDINPIDDEFEIIFRSCAPPGIFREFYTLSIFAVMAHVIIRFVPKSQNVLRFELDFEPESGIVEAIGILSRDIKSGVASTRIIGQSNWLSLPNVTFDRSFWELSLDRVQNLESDSEVPNIEQRVRRYIKTALVQEKRVPRLKQIAALEGVSERTMLRMLAENDLSFHIISEDVRRVMATEMISLPSVPLSEISESLGFTDLSSFSRSFRKWFGATPGQYRKSQER
ncbi:AraC family transcriptional regulator [Sphingorhabdus pulchriflava]|uniref:AraC family transcriptional regulator n=1 Tax=Sphingorhabdus pulchriflava TaxID=2292257 RepID=A0A371B4G8_9SPHN|nr:helix-turn-helix transcriptional regulator [Sphingorhabdus pulchriflava]RDV02450.1 AraC family transcriptional regulator [Sphingorhabdus pulchriflava]